MTQMTTDNYAKMNRLNLYYERSGEAQPGTVPLILLHGGQRSVGHSGGGRRTTPHRYKFWTFARGGLW